MPLFFFVCRTLTQILAGGTSLSAWHSRSPHPIPPPFLLLLAPPPLFLLLLAPPPLLLLLLAPPPLLLLLLAPPPLLLLLLAPPPLCSCWLLLLLLHSLCWLLEEEALCGPTVGQRGKGESGDFSQKEQEGSHCPEKTNRF